MFDELKAFDVVDTLVELLQQGTLPIGLGDAGKMLYKYWKDAPNRMSEAERRNFYRDDDGHSRRRRQRHGQPRLQRSVAALRLVGVVAGAAEDVDQLLRQAIPASISQQPVRKAARDLAVNLSLHGFGMVFYAARDLQDQIKMMIELLDHERSSWRTARATCGRSSIRSPRSSSAARAAARATARWPPAAPSSRGGCRTTSEIQLVVVARGHRHRSVTSTYPPTAGANATTTPTDYDLVNACELWLPDTAIPESQVEDVASRRAKRRR